MDRRILVRALIIVMSHFCVAVHVGIPHEAMRKSRTHTGFIAGRGMKNERKNFARTNSITCEDQGIVTGISLRR